MADVFDNADIIIERYKQLAIDKAREEASKIPVGTQGYCALCPEFSLRLVNDVCAPCRDRYGLP